MHRAAPAMFRGERLYVTFSCKNTVGKRTPKEILPEIMGRMSPNHKMLVDGVLLSVESYNREELKEYTHVHALFTFVCTVILPFSEIDRVLGIHGHYKRADRSDALIKYICKQGSWWTWDPSNLMTGGRYARRIKEILNKKRVEGPAPDVHEIQANESFMVANHFATDLCLKTNAQKKPPCHSGNRNYSDVQSWP